MTSPVSVETGITAEAVERQCRYLDQFTQQTAQEARETMRALLAERAQLQAQVEAMERAMWKADQVVGELEGVSIVWYLQKAGAHDVLAHFDAAIARGGKT